MSEENTTTGAVVKAEPSMEVLKYKEELAEKMGLPSPYGMGLMKELASDLVASGMVPKVFGANPMAVYMAAMRGREMELQPMESILETFFPAPGGNLGMYAKKMLQILHRGGVTSEFQKEDAEGCEILFTPPPPHKPYLAKFYATEAVAAGLDKPDSNWRKWRSDMNRARAISRGYRGLLGTFGKLSNFTGYSHEELEDEGAFRRSTTDEPSAADLTREQQLTGKEGAFRVEVKEKPGQATVEVQPQPVQESSGTESATAEPTPRIPDMYEIHRMFQTGSGGAAPIACPDEQPQANPDSACVRAQALANETGSDHLVVHVWPDGSRSDHRKLTAPTAIKTPAPNAPKPAASPAAPATPAAPSQAAAPAPSAEAAKKPQSPEATALHARIEYLGATYLQGVPANTYKPRFRSYWSGFLGKPIKQLPGDPKAYNEPTDELENLLVNDINEFNAGPEEAGKRAARRKAEIRAFMAEQNPVHPTPENPDPDPVNFSLANRLASKWGMASADFIRWYQSEPVALDFATISDSEAHLRLCLMTREASRIRKLSLRHHLSVAMLVEQMEQRSLGTKIEAATVKQVEAAIAAVEQAAKSAAEEIAKPQPVEPPAAQAPPPQPEDPSDEDSGDIDLFKDFS